MVKAYFETKGYAVTAAPVKLLESNVSRKGLVIGNGAAGVVEFAIGYEPGTEDYIKLAPGKVFQFDGIVPVLPIWGKGTGTLVIGEVN